MKEIIRQGELRLQAQLQSALAADARAGVLASIQAAVVAALVVFGGSDEVVAATEAAAYTAAAFTFIGAILAGIAARPIAFDFPGLAPLDWAEAIQTGEAEDSANRAYAEYLDEYIRMLVQVIGDDTECGEENEVNLTLEIFAREGSYEASADTVEAIAGAARKALTRELQLTGHVMDDWRFEGDRPVSDPDVLTAHRSVSINYLTSASA